MKRFTVMTALGALLLCGTTAVGGEKISLPTGKAAAKPQMTATAERGTAPITNVRYYGWRGGRRGYYGYGAYRPYYGGYGYGYGGYYTRPYYGYSYYSPGWGYGFGPGVGIGVGPAWGPGVGVGIGPMARFGGGWYW
ncbi:MAG TPA: hypothetical protein VHC22_12045 [Pirellulales bacterium]|nr:hypothetical protein [Pirellulales bacterium]